MKKLMEKNIGKRIHFILLNNLGIIDRLVLSSYGL